MGRRNARRLALLAIALAACVVNLTFDMEQSGLVLTSPAQMALSTTAAVDLGSYQDVRAHQKDIKSLDLDSADVTISDIKSDNLAQHMTLMLSLRKSLSDPPENDVVVGNIPDFPVIPHGTVRIPGNAAVDTFLLDRLHEDGKFYVVVSGSTDNKTDVVLDVNLHASMGYDTGLF